MNVFVNFRLGASMNSMLFINGACSMRINPSSAFARVRVTPFKAISPLALMAM
jgi:hypothetical protein